MKRIGRLIKLAAPLGLVFLLSMAAHGQDKSAPPPSNVIQSIDVSTQAGTVTVSDSRMRRPIRRQRLP